MKAAANGTKPIVCDFFYNLAAHTQLKYVVFLPKQLCLHSFLFRFYRVYSPLAGLEPVPSMR